MIPAELLRAYAEWEAAAAQVVVADPIWGLRVFRIARFVAVIASNDAADLANHALNVARAEQLLRAADSISANIAEGYSRSSTKDRARYYEIALGSAREAREWYDKARRELGAPIVDSRIELLSRLIGALVLIVRRQREKTLRTL